MAGAFFTIICVLLFFFSVVSSDIADFGGSGFVVSLDLVDLFVFVDFDVDAVSVED